MRLHQNVINMVAAMVVVMLGVGAVYFTTMRTAPDEINTFDFASQLSLARAQAQSFTPVRPLPADRWEITSASFSRVDDVETWRVGVALSSDRYLWIEQVDGKIDQAQARWSRDGQVVGSVEVLGVPRQHWVSGQWRALTFSDEGVALAIFGEASLDELVELAQSLSGS